MTAAAPRENLYSGAAALRVGNALLIIAAGSTVEIMPHALLVDRKQKVLVAQLSGTLSEDSLSAVRAAVRRFIAKEGSCRAILDLSAIERADVSGRFIAALAESGPIISGAMRVIVAPKPEVFGLSRMYELHQYSTADSTLVVRTRAEAHEALGVTALELELIEDEERRA